MDTKTRIREIWAVADDEGRDTTSSERDEIEHLLDRLDSEGIRRGIKTQLEGGGGEHERGSGGEISGGPGDRFIQSKGWQAVSDPANRGSRWSTGLIEVSPGPMYAKGTLLEGSGSPGSGTGGGFVPSAQVVPGVVAKLFQPLSFEALLSSAQATGNTVRYAVEGTALSGAAGVAEGGDKPQSTLAVSTLDEPIKKVATSIGASDELIDDAVALQSFVNDRLALFVNLEIERQLFRGASGGNEVQGILTSRGVPVFAGGTAAGNKAIQLFKAMNGVRGSAFVEPEWMVLHPTDYEQIRLLTDSSGQLLGGGPFLGPYGGPQGPVGASGQITGALDSIWNKPVYVTSAIGGAGTALIGNSQAAQVWSRGGVSCEITNSHSDWFFKDLVAIRAERRLGLTVYRPAGFCEVRLA